MSRYVLGLSYGFHDASAAIVSRDGVLAFAAEERLSRQKHDSSFPRFAIEQCLRESGLTLGDISEIAYHERPEPAFTRVLTTALAGFPRSSREFSASMRTWLSKKLWVRSEIATRIGIERPVELHPHHDCHAAQSYLTSGYSDAAILTLDAVGEWTSTGVYWGQKDKVHPLRAVKFPHSLGLFYSAMTAFLGFTPMDGECSTMALAAFGRPFYADYFWNIVKLTPEGFTIDQSYFSFVEFYNRPYTDKLVKVLGTPRSAFQKLNFSSWSQETISPDEQRWADIAASVQLVYEESVIHLASLAKRLTGSHKLCLSGGGAMNSVAMKKLVDTKLFEGLYIPPDPGDGGAAVGAALLSLANLGELSQASLWKPWSGLSVEKNDLGFVSLVDPEHVRRFSKVGLDQKSFTIEAISVDDDAVLTEQVSALIVDHKIVGWCQGRFESGPRALGSRSILIRPDCIELAQRLSQDVKARAAFRPYALSLRESDAERVLTDYRKDLRPYQWMQIVDSVNPDHADALKAGLHIDGTTRPQVVLEDEHPKYHKLLEAVGNRLGLGVLINTSFNESGYPIVATSREALAIFLRSGMDALVIENTIYRKIYPKEESNSENA